MIWAAICNYLGVWYGNIFKINIGQQEVDMVPQVKKDEMIMICSSKMLRLLPLPVQDKKK